MACAVLIAILVDSERKLAEHREHAGERTEAEKFHFRSIGKLLINGNIYLMGSVIFMGYATYWTVYYLGGFLQTKVGVDAVTVGTITTIVLWMRPVGGFIGGFLADRIGRPQTVAGAVVGAAVLLTLLTMLPITSVKTFYVVIVVLGIFLYAIRGHLLVAVGPVRHRRGPDGHGNRGDLLHWLSARHHPAAAELLSHRHLW